MPDTLTPHELAAIAAYQGGVQRIPRGVSGEPEYRFDAARHGDSFASLVGKRTAKDVRDASFRITTRNRRFAALRRREQDKTPQPVECERVETVLVMVTPPKAPEPKPKRARRERPVKTKRMAEKSAICRDREAKVREMFLAGTTRPAMARALGVSLGMIHKHMERLRREGSLPPARSPELTKRRAK
jgi:hypothetical protein